MRQESSREQHDEGPLRWHFPRQWKSETKAVLADKLLEAKINSALSEHISVTMAPNGIAVSVAGGKVTLAGTCSSGAVRAKAEKAAQGIAGVVEINNRIISVPSRGSGY